MKPLPQPHTTPHGPRAMPSLPLGSHSMENRRVAGACRIQKAYPWLLFASTTIAAVFCLAYITKPVIASHQPIEFAAPLPPVAVSPPSTANEPVEQLLKDEGSLPGEVQEPSQEAPLRSSLAAEFEETNIRIQHVLDAESPSGDINRIVLDVPVIYQSRNLRWTEQQAVEARALLTRLSEYQEKSRSLRDEGAAVLAAWDRLMAASIPAQALRADSPSLPSNQKRSGSTGTAPSPDTVETIKLRKSGE